MRIDKDVNPIQPLIHGASKKTNGGHSHGPHHIGGTSQTGAANSIDGLLRVLGNTTEIRESVVNDVKAKIQTGEYLTQQAAYDAASAILNL